ncbi:hypothetical protein T4D_1643 [Trichinella pseudospiralis]|uniref:Uncharacterized protein n=1 Tax=Trichinella pseudospiralis TaxID=6337 RepID=A0A0V1FMB7_TRIPS|nr:hypothetical protein T4D_1643 [Trichinella pseudospiralis]
MFSCKRERSRKVNTYSSDQQDYLEIVQYTPAKTENTLHYGGTTNRPCRVDICSETLYVENFAQQSALNRYARCSIEVKAEAMSSFNPEGGPNTAFDHMMEAEKPRYAVTKTVLQQRSHREHVLSNEISHCGQQQGGLLYLTRTLLVQSEAVQRWQRPGRIPVITLLPYSERQNKMIAGNGSQMCCVVCSKTLRILPDKKREVLQFLHYLGDRSHYENNSTDTKNIAHVLKSPAPRSVESLSVSGSHVWLTSTLMRPLLKRFSDSRRNLKHQQKYQPSSVAQFCKRLCNLAVVRKYCICADSNGIFVIGFAVSRPSNKEFRLDAKDAVQIRIDTGHSHNRKITRQNVNTMDMENTIVAFSHFGASCLLTAHSLCLRSGTGFTRWDDGCIVTAGRGKEVHSSQGATTTVNGNVHEMMFIVQRMEKRFHSVNVSEFQLRK